MKRPRFTIRWLMIVVAIAGVGFGAIAPLVRMFVAELQIMSTRPYEPDPPEPE